MLIPVGIKDPSSGAEILLPSKNAKYKSAPLIFLTTFLQRLRLYWGLRGHCFYNKISNNNTDTNIIANVIKFITLGFIKIPKKSKRCSGLAFRLIASFSICINLKLLTLFPTLPLTICSNYFEHFNIIWLQLQV